VHGEEQPTLHQIKEIFLSLSDELLDHLPKEEEVLFPALRRLAQQEKAGTKNTDLILQGPISVMEHEHDAAGTLLKELRALTGQYQPPAFACPTYQLAFKLLEEFDRDLVQHIHLENNILFPKATSTH
jgi:regulator of cell morphogenesis and NO signaling